MSQKKSKITKILILVIIVFIIAGIFLSSLYIDNIGRESEISNELNKFDMNQIESQDVNLSTGASIKIFKSNKENSNGRGVVVIPGGGYFFVAGDHEGASWVPLFYKLGYTTAVLRYTVPPKSHNGPLNEVIEAMTYLRNNTVWNINTNTIGVMGSSAGGHMASTVATHTEGENIPSFQILFYPVITMDAEYAHIGSRNNLIGENPSPEMIDLYSNEKQVKANTPPAYITWADNDDIVPPKNSINYVNALKTMNVTVHVKKFNKGEHGFGYNPFKYHGVLVEDLYNWLQDMDSILKEKEL